MADTVPVPLVSLFTEVEDPRRPQARRHALEDILLIATLAVICGADSWTEVELFGRQKQAWLETFLALPARDPLARHLRTRLCAAGPRPAGGLLYALGTVAGGESPGPGRGGGRQGGPSLPRRRPGGCRPCIR